MARITDVLPFMYSFDYNFRFHGVFIEILVKNTQTARTRLLFYREHYPYKFTISMLELCEFLFCSKFYFFNNLTTEGLNIALLKHRWAAGEVRQVLFILQTFIYEILPPWRILGSFYHREYIQDTTTNM